METVFPSYLAELLPPKNDVDDALVIDSARVPDYVRVGVTPDKVQQAIARLNSLNVIPGRRALSAATTRAITRSATSWLTLLFMATLSAFTGLYAKTRLYTTNR